MREIILRGIISDAKVPASALRGIAYTAFASVHRPLQNGGITEARIFSLKGWGTACKKEKIGGYWSSLDSEKHINHLELMAAHYALKTFAENLRGVTLLLRVDNTTAVAYINKMGGIQYPELNKLAKDLWQWCEKRNLFVFASYISSKNNKDADDSSRNKNVDTEWELSECAFNSIFNKWGPFDIDLFASKVNAKIEKFCAWRKEPDACVIDAFTLDWSNFYFYAFPPFAIISKIISKIISEKAHGILIVPYWPTQPWWPLFIRLLADKPLILKPSHDLLLSPCRLIRHPLADQLSLIAGRLSGKLF